MGTSLTVYPFASLAQRVDDSCPRVLINLDHVGDIGSRRDDVALLGKCDDVVKDLCKELGWEDELIRLWNETDESVISEPQDTSEPGPAEAAKSASSTSNTEEVKKPDALREIEKQFARLELEVEAEEPTSTPDLTTQGKKETVNPSDAPSVSTPELAATDTLEATVTEDTKALSDPPPPSSPSGAKDAAKTASTSGTDNKL